MYGSPLKTIARRSVGALVLSARMDSIAGGVISKNGVTPEICPLGLHYLPIQILEEKRSGSKDYVIVGKGECGHRIFLDAEH